jgi:hypothetical protein
VCDVHMLMYMVAEVIKATAVVITVLLVRMTRYTEKAMYAAYVVILSQCYYGLTKPTVQSMRSAHTVCTSTQCMHCKQPCRYIHLYSAHTIDILYTMKYTTSVSIIAVPLILGI